MEIKSVKIKAESTKKFITTIQTQITYLRACTSKLENDILRHELRLIDFDELQAGIEKTLEKVRKEIME